MKKLLMAGLGVMFLGVVSAVHAEMEVKVKDNTANNGFSIKEETTGSTIARFRGDGNVGIGTTNPDAMLTVGNYTSSGRIYVKTSDIGLIVRSLNPQAPSNEAQILSGTLIKDTYAVGDKVSIVLGMTDLPGGLASHIEAIAEDVNISTRKCGLRILTTNFENDGLKERIRIAGNGNVGIDTTNPAYKLDVNGTIRGSNVSPSDMRWKENVKTLDNSLEKVNKLRGVSFEWKDKAKGAGTQVGLIAQEVEKVFPEVVSEDNEGYKSVAYDKLVGVLVESIKELKVQKDAEVAALKAEIEALKESLSNNVRVVAQ